MSQALAEMLDFSPQRGRRKDPVVRDSQRQRVYDAEDAAHWKTLGVSIQGHRIANAGLQARLDEIMAMRAIQSRWGRHRIIVDLTHGGGHASGRWSIALGRIGRNDWYICHEIAHCLTWGVGAAHGPEYAGVYLFLVKTVMGQAAYDNLLAEFRAKKVRRTNSALPAAGTHKVVTKAAKAARTRAVAERPTGAAERREAASVIRRAVKEGLYGPSGCKPRTHALASARLLEK